ncbi:hypothetical protein [Enterobacter hormaechei]|uniref:hypothetical protein n=1 Tax=Enterobacter hormaechei TaxID=158836 RepID=UPI003AB28E94
MECKVSDLVKRGHDQSAELKASCGAVDVRDVAQLISDLATQLDVQLARSNALAAENAGLKAAVTQQIELRAEIKKAGRPPHADFWVQSICEAEEKVKRSLEDTPITDAYLAEVRAQGVERLANAWYAIANETDPGISISDSSRLKYRQRADDAADFANEIRQEAAQ